MNDYRITYTTAAGGSDTSTITERTEAAARKFFTAMNKGLGFTVSDVQLIRENTSATKWQERDTLEAIKKMVAELGPQSYLATAFEGAFEDAENNIDDDAAYSMKSRWESEKETSNKLRAAVSDLEKKLKAAEITERDLREAIKKTKAEGSRIISALREQIFGEDDLEDLRQLLEDRECAAAEAEAKAAEEIVKYADDPTSKEFQQAVTDHRNLKKAAEYFTGLKFRVELALKAAHTYQNTTGA